MKRSTAILISIGAGFFLLAGGTAAGAATGASFILGKANSETAQASLKNSTGTPLKLTAPANAAPLKVSNSNLVTGLNAQYLSGMTETGLAVTGGEGFTAPATNAPIGLTPTVVASTGTLAGGTYYVSATALLDVAPNDSSGMCAIATGSAPGHPLNWSLEKQTSYFTVAETAAVTVSAGDTLEEVCQAGNNNGSVASDAGIIAIRVLSSSHQ